MFSSQQDTYLCDHYFQDVQKNKFLFPDPVSYQEYDMRRRWLRSQGAPVASLVGNLPLFSLPPFEQMDDLHYVEAALETQRRAKGVQPFLNEIKIEISTQQRIGIMFMSDFHVGNVSTDLQGIIRDVQMVKANPNILVYVGGDPIDNFITPKLAHAGRDSQMQNPEIQYAIYRWIIQQLGDQLIAVGRGNHDAWTQSMSGIDGISAALRGMKVRHTGESCYLDIEIDNGTYTQSYTIFRKHRPKGSTRMDVTSGMKYFYTHGERIFDIGVGEHFHAPGYSRQNLHGLDRHFLATGTYKTYDPHAKEFGYNNGGVSSPVVILHPFQREILVVSHIDQAIDLLI